MGAGITYTVGSRPRLWSGAPMGLGDGWWLVECGNPCLGLFLFQDAEEFEDGVFFVADVLGEAGVAALRVSVDVPGKDRVTVSINFICHREHSFLSL